MLNTRVWGKTSKLAKDINANSTELRLPSGMGSQFPNNGLEHFYLTIRNGGTREIVKVVSRVGDTLQIERAQDGTMAQSFPKESCLSVEWNPIQLCEFVKECAGSCAKVTPQVINVQCGTSIEINECGNIINVNGGTRC